MTGKTLSVPERLRQAMPRVGVGPRSNASLALDKIVAM